MFKKLTIVCTIILLAVPVLSQKLQVSVMDLNVSEGLTQPQVAMLTDKLINDLVTAQVYQVVERSKRDEILREQGFQQTGACDQGACLVEAGQLLGVQKMIGGTIGKLGSVYSLQLRVIDVKTGGIDKAFSKSYSGDISLLLEGMQEAAGYFSGVKLDITRQKETMADDGLVFLQTNAQGYKEYRNVKDGSVLIEIPAGEFIMGSNEGDKDEKPIHKVYLDKYYIGKFEVTIGQYRKFCVATRETLPTQPDWNDDDNFPVVNVWFKDVKNYCTWAGLQLPTEAQWEKAARGTDGREYPWGQKWDATKCNSNEKADRCENTAPVGSFPAGISPFGGHDMTGNVWEHCNDRYGSDYYSTSPGSNPTGPLSGDDRVLRGGGWHDGKNDCRVTNRANGYPSFWYAGIESMGFRVAK